MITKSVFTHCCCHYLSTSDGAYSPFLWLLLVRYEADNDADLAIVYQFRKLISNL
ncbi:hypothetical protein HanXRQr2_Chr08g0340801 [Helianthus annuus]|uniref:Uncharacterized protein n=1 Tax=Helianthus annuus TaxID=4232 RepID=A0A9K3NCM0_HELAN|nr:hypothetical protein HanXRQr2_Chr08g0340801 [Helianthus annuus]KAJ0539026.1 hypothetical protein HanHA300_Chr08g0281601 [Helianthus annuus]KAJ0722553.1 hypothetical protein HanOQP8_Chr08g0287931 [Helianthus annuus]